MGWNKIHPDFRLNGISVNQTNIIEVSASLLTEEEDFTKDIGSFLQEWASSKDFIIVRTSGSTGVPKPIKLKKEHMVNSARATASFFKLKPKNTALLCMSAQFIAGKMMLVRALVLGLHITVVKASSNPIKNLTTQFNFCAMVPLQLQNSLENIGKVKTIIVGGAPMSMALKENVKNVQSHIFETYGMTETITHIAVKKISNTSKNTFSALPGVTLSIDARGCLLINAPKIADAIVVTNDLVALHSKTEFSWLGRHDSVINSGGIKLIPEQIEEKLAKIIETKFFVSGIPDEVLGQKLVLVLEGNKNPSKLLLKMKQLGLGKYQIPKTVHCIPKFVSTPTGKINRKETLKHLYL